MSGKRHQADSVAEGFLDLLEARGIRYFLGGGAGTDFPPFIEAFAKRAAQRQQGRRGSRDSHDGLQPLTVIHEITAVSMAHGYTMVTGEPLAVMVHTIAGTANAVGGIINAARARIPMLVAAGRTSITEKGHRTSRTAAIHWAQESFDQAGLVREFVKWDYELRRGEQLETVVDRALAIAANAPSGPVYLTLPLDVAGEPPAAPGFGKKARLRPSAPAQPGPEAIAAAARTLVAAENPLIVVSSLGRDPQAVPALVALAERLAVPVVESWGAYLNFPHDHPLHQGFEPGALVADADVIVAVESDTPWFPNQAEPRAGATVIQIDDDPLYQRYPIRGYPTDIGLAGHAGSTLRALDAQVAAQLEARDEVESDAGAAARLEARKGARGANQPVARVGVRADAQGAPHLAAERPDRTAIAAGVIDRAAIDARRRRWADAHRQQRRAWQTAGDAALGDAASGSAASGSAASGDAASGGAASGGAASGDAASGDAASGDAASGSAASGDAASGGAAFGEAASGAAMSAPAVSGEAPRRRPSDYRWISRCIGAALADDDIAVTEISLDPTQTCFTRPGTYFSHPHSGVLGWAPGAALGAKLACPERTVVCAIGDGSHVFGVPTATHFMARSCGLPVLFVIYNNGAWQRTREATFRYAPGGWAERADAVPLCELEPSPRFEMICEANGGYGERVEAPEELPAALQRALHAVRVEKRQALLNVIAAKG